MKSSAFNVNSLGANPIKSSNTLQQCCRRIVWVCLTILWGWRLKGCLSWWLWVWLSATSKPCEVFHLKSVTSSQQISFWTLNSHQVKSCKKADNKCFSFHSAILQSKKSTSKFGYYHCYLVLCLFAIFRKCYEGFYFIHPENNRKCDESLHFIHPENIL